MQQKTKTITVYELEERDIQTIKNCLNYAYHRMMKHGKSIGVDAMELQRLRGEFGIIEKDNFVPFSHIPKAFN